MKLLLTINVLLSYFTVITSNTTEQHRLYKFLFTDYNSDIRPVFNQNDTIVLRIQTILIDIIDVVNIIFTFLNTVIHNLYVKYNHYIRVSFYLLL
jgi:hypothetical protein